jgi:two-component system NarL family response regulator
MRILLVDDSKRFLSGLKNMLESHNYQVVGVATSAAEAMRQTEALAPDLVLMDIQMPGQSGIEATRGIKQAHPLLKIVMMTVSDSDEHLFEAIAAGADGYLLKGEPERFVDALASLARGESPLSPGLATKIMAEFARRARVPEGAANSAPTGNGKSGETLSDYEEKLTERQQWILSLIARGCSYQEIARQVGISVAGVNYHVAEITARLHVENRAQAIACYLAQK